MTSTLEPLILDMVEWVAKEPRSYAEALEVWRTSCPRLTVWEEAFERGLVERRGSPGRSAQVVVTAVGRDILQQSGRLSGAGASSATT